jgi:hypothetical protein
MSDTFEKSSFVGTLYSMSFSFDSEISSRASSLSSFSFESLSSSLDQASLRLQPFDGDVGELVGVLAV